MSVSTIATPIAAAIPEECPEGKEYDESTWIGSSKTGRSRPITCLTSVVSTPTPIITMAVQIAARR